MGIKVMASTERLFHPIYVVIYHMIFPYMHFAKLKQVKMNKDYEVICFKIVFRKE